MPMYSVTVGLNMRVYHEIDIMAKDVSDIDAIIDEDLLVAHIEETDQQSHIDDMSAYICHANVIGDDEAFHIDKDVPPNKPSPMTISPELASALKALWVQAECVHEVKDMAIDTGISLSQMQTIVDAGYALVKQDEKK